MPVSSASSSVMSFRADEISEIIPDAQGVVIDDHVQFSVGNTNMRVRKKISDASKEIEELISNQRNRCGKEFSASQVETLREAFKGKDAILYTLYDPELVTVMPALYFIQLLPNAVGYEDFESVNEDFEMCAMGSLPLHTMSQKWLLFGASACGGVWDLCNETEETLKPSIKLR